MPVEPGTQSVTLEDRSELLRVVGEVLRRDGRVLDERERALLPHSRRHEEPEPSLAEVTYLLLHLRGVHAQRRVPVTFIRPALRETIGGRGDVVS